MKMSFTLPCGSIDLGTLYPLLRMGSHLVMISGEKGIQDETHFFTCALDFLRNLKQIERFFCLQSHMNDESA